MPCTTILVGKKATYDGSTMIARNDDSPSSSFHVKKAAVVLPEDQPNVYVSVGSHVRIELPDHPLRYTAKPNVDPKEGIWAAAGVNELNVSMSATETITSNGRVLGADPYVEFHKAEEGREEVIGGIGEEDLVVLVLPYIHSAREGVLRLGSLLEQYGTYEPNGIAFSDVDEVWWLETIGGHHWIARRVPDDRYVVMPNQFGMDEFDFEDAFGEKKENLCSSDLREFVQVHHLDLSLNGKFNPRLAFGSHSDSDHVYNTPRAWFIERYLNPRTCRWDGPNADFTPESDDIPWSRVPERKITIEDVKYLLSSYYQGTPYNPYAKFGDSTMKGAYRPIGISRTSFLTCTQIRPYVPKEIQAIEWLAFGSNAFNAFVPLYPGVEALPGYFSGTTLTVSTESFYWANRIIGALADAHFQVAAIHIERYQEAVEAQTHNILERYDALMADEKHDPEAILNANAEMATMVKSETEKCLDRVLYEASCHMKNGYSRSDN